MHATSQSNRSKSGKTAHHTGILENFPNYRYDTDNPTARFAGLTLGPPWCPNIPACYYL